MPQSTQPRSRTLNVRSDGSYRFTRLTDSQYSRLRGTSLAIEENPWFELKMSGASHRSLGEVYASLKCLFGERGREFDDWKGDFAFPLALEVPGAARRPAYLLNVLNFRSSVEHRFRKLVQSSDPRLRNNIYYPPEGGEFSRQQMERFLAFFVGFQEGYYEMVCRDKQEPFLLTVPSNAILYGFDGERFFEESFDSEKSFDKRRLELAACLPPPGFYPDD